MSQREQEFEFLRQMLVREDSAERQQLKSQLDEAEQRLRCIRRTFRFVAFVMALSAVGVGYGLVFLPGIIERRPHFLLQFFYTVLTGCLISLTTYSVTWLWQSHLANRLRERGRQLLLDGRVAGENRAAAFYPRWNFHERGISGMATVSRGLTVASEVLNHKAP